MKKIKILIFMLFVMLLPIYVKADTASVAISCSPSSVNAGASTECTITGSSDVNISRVAMSVTENSRLSYDFVIDSGFNGTSTTGGYNSGEHKIDISRNENDFATGSFNVGKLTVQVSGNDGGEVQVALSNIVFYDANGNTINATNTGVTIPVTGVGLKPLTVTDGVLSPQLTADNYGYSVRLDSESTTSFGISAVANNSSDTITFVNGDTNETIANPSNIQFVTDEGKNSMSIKINVGSNSQYTLTVTKPVSSSASNELSTLSIGGVAVSLSSGKYDYEVTLINNSSYQVDATLKDSDNFKIANLTLPTTMTGDEFAIVVSPKDNSSGLSGTTYTVKVKKGGSNSSDNGSASNTSNNPQTGGVAITMAIVLIASFALSIYLYKKNIEGYN